MPINQDWKIRSRAHSCCHTGKPFEDEEEFYTAIFTDPESGELTRQDYCLEAWDAIHESLQPFSFWKSVYHQPVTEKKKEVVGKEGAEALLRRLIEENEAHTENARYILAVMLERKRTLRQTDTQFSGQSKLLIYEHAKTGDVLIVRDPELKIAESEQVQAEVALLLGASQETGDAPTQDARDGGGAGEAAAAGAEPPAPEPSPAATPQPS
jgi:hypothetical protein